MTSHSGSEPEEAARGVDVHNLAVCILCAPALSLFAYLAGLLVFTLPETLAGLSAGSAAISALIRGVFGYVWMTVLVVLWGLVPSILFGGAGCWLAERMLGRRAWPLWGLAGLAAAMAYVLVSLGVRLLAQPLSFVVAPWVFRAEMSPDAAGPISPWDLTLAGTAVSILTGGFLAGVLYFRLSRGGWMPIGADKRT